VEWAPQTPRKWEGDAAARRYKVPKGNSSICPGDETHVFQRVAEKGKQNTAALLNHHRKRAVGFSHPVSECDPPRGSRSSHHNYESASGWKE
jgi:hypothetical protein